MLSLLPIVIALAIEPAPAASSSPRPTPLTEIGRVQARPICATIVAHANGAITQTLDNDRALAIMELNLKQTDFDALNELQRHNAEEEIAKQAEAVRTSYHAADQEIKRLRELAAESKDPERKAELKRFADALGGALNRQQKAANAVVSVIALVRGREDASQARDLMASSNQVPATLQAQQATLDESKTPPLPGTPKSYDAIYREAAGRLADADAAIMVDEGVAADHSIQAASGC
ncbi:MAG TPA: hypothetical protein VFB22_17750 [Candidatus Baltobacteraceae bacterium]|nr:hypothetical protein [Candidatus Baltobacteraceae bacterium]